MSRRLAGYDLNGWRDCAARSWRQLPGDEEEFGRFIISGGVNSAVVSVDGSFIGGPIAQLAPQGRGDGWGQVGEKRRRASVRLLRTQPWEHEQQLSATFAALGQGAQVGVIAIDDTGQIDDRAFDGWLSAMRGAGIRRGFHIWRPVLAVLKAVDSGLVDDDFKTVAVVSQQDVGLATQLFTLRQGKVRAPERRRAGQLFPCAFGYQSFHQAAEVELAPDLDSSRAGNDFSNLEGPVRWALGEEQPAELLRDWRGGWMHVPSLPKAVRSPEDLPPGLCEAIASTDLVLLESLSSGTVVEDLKKLLAASTKAPVLPLPSNAVAEGGLVAAERLAAGLPAYFDFLPQISTIVQSRDGPVSYDLIPADAVLPAGEVYRSGKPAQFGLHTGQEKIKVFLLKEGQTSPRKAELALPKGMNTQDPISCRVEQSPAQGRARIILDGAHLASPLVVDWDQAEPLEEDWDGLIGSLQDPPPTVPNRLVLPATRELWEDNKRGGLRDLLLQETMAREPNWDVLANKFSQRINVEYFTNAGPLFEKAYCVTSDGALPPGLTSEDSDLLDSMIERALDVTLKRLKSGHEDQSSNDALRFLTWTFRRCPREVVPHLLDALEARAGGHPFVRHQSSRVLVFQGLGRVLDEAEWIDQVLEHLRGVPVSDWRSKMQIACLAFLLSRTDAGPKRLQQVDLDELPRIACQMLDETVRKGSVLNLHYPPFLIVGLLRRRIVDPYAFVVDTDPRAAIMHQAISRNLPKIRRLRATATLSAIVRVLEQTWTMLEGSGGNPDLLREIASL